MSEFTLCDQITIEAPVAVVWRVLTAFDGDAGRARGSIVHPLTPEPHGVGSRFHELVRVGRFWANFDLECTAWEPGRLFAWRAHSFGVRGEHRWALDDFGGSTLVRDAERFWGPWPLIMLARALFVPFRVKLIRRRSLESLRSRSLAQLAHTQV